MPDGGPAAGVRIERLGEAGLLVVLGDRIDGALNDEVHRLAAAVRTRRLASPGIGAPVPGYASVLVPFDPLAIGEDDVRAVIHAALAGGEGLSPAESRSSVTIPVRYGGADGPDLAEVAARLGRTEADVVRLHAGTVYRVFVVGFVPGFPYLGTLPDELVLPRRATPRTRVPAGSVAIAGRQTGIYPAATPGGWHLIGRTDVELWNPRREPPAFLAPGTSVRFEAA